MEEYENIGGLLGGRCYVWSATSVSCCAAARANFASRGTVGFDIPGVMLRFTDEGKSAGVGSRPGMAGVARCALLQANRRKADAGCGAEVSGMLCGRSYD